MRLRARPVDEVFADILGSGNRGKLLKPGRGLTPNARGAVVRAPPRPSVELIRMGAVGATLATTIASAIGGSNLV